jgi:hypothetical protein
MPSSTKSRFTRRALARQSTAAATLAFGGTSSSLAADTPERPPRDLLARLVTRERLNEILIPCGRWHPYPTAQERDKWEALGPDTLGALIGAGERQLKTPWNVLPATLALEFKRNGNRSRYEHERTLRRNKLQEMAVAECAEGKGRFLDEIVNGIWLTCEETFWGVPAHIGVQKAGVGLPDVAEPIVDLFAAETSQLLAWILYLLRPGLDTVSPLVAERIHLEIDRRLITPTLERDNIGWMGFISPRPPNNWNPWIASNWLASTLICERNEDRRRASVHKALRVIDKFLNGYADDGGCDEGPSYWGVAGGALFDCLDLLYLATAGQADAFSNPLVKEIGRYIYRAHIHDDWYVNFADAAARTMIAGDMVYRYGRRIGDEKMCGLGALAAQRSRGPARMGSLSRQLPAVFNIRELRNARAFEPLPRDAWFAGIQVMTARRKEGSPTGLYIAAQGGHNAESHNHNDVGNFILYGDGEPVIIDVGVETYTAKTFSSRRYEIWTMQSAYHNVPTVGGVMQKPGREYAASDVAYQADDTAAQFDLDIAHAWGPEAGITSWKRTLRLDRERNQVTVRDRYALSKTPGEITLSLMTQAKPDASKPGVLGLAQRVTAAYDASVFTAKVEDIVLEDAHLRAIWGERIHRVLLVASRPPATADWTLRFTQSA